MSSIFQEKNVLIGYLRYTYLDDSIKIGQDHKILDILKTVINTKDFNITLKEKAQALYNKLFDYSDISIYGEQNNKKGSKRGIIIAKRYGDKIKVGYSLLSPKETDPIDWEIAYNTAYTRMDNNIPNPKFKTDILEVSFNNFIKRIKRYFKCENSDIICLIRDK
jgi:hypothetical protein